MKSTKEMAAYTKIKYKQQRKKYDINIRKGYYNSPEGIRIILQSLGIEARDLLSVDIAIRLKDITCRHNEIYG